MNRIKKNKIIVITISYALIGFAILTLSNRLGNHQKIKSPLEANSTYTKRVIALQYPSYNSIEETYNASQVVIKGKALESEINEITVSPCGTYKYPYLITKVKVSKVLKGDVAEDSIIFVKQLVDTENVKISGDFKEELLKNSDQHYLFLNSFGADSSVMPYSIINPAQGNFKISQDTIIALDKSMTVNGNDTIKKYLNGMPTIAFEMEVNNFKSKN